MADHQMLLDVFGTHPLFHVVEAEGDPPERYVFHIQVPGLREENGALALSESHRVEIFLPRDYPRRPPICRMLTPIYHPNIDPHKICIGDHWSADQSLVHLVVRVAEMICYQSYNVKSPLQAEAAAWAEQNPQRLPLADTDLSRGT
jgi:hypothetical protein